MPIVPIFRKKLAARFARVNSLLFHFRRSKFRAELDGSNPLVPCGVDKYVTNSLLWYNTFVQKEKVKRRNG